MSGWEGCPSCGAMVAPGKEEVHAAWHEQQRQALAHSANALNTIREVLASVRTVLQRHETQLGSRRSRDS